MLSLRALLAVAILVWSLGGLTIAAPRIAEQHYLDYGLHRLAIDALSDALRSALRIALPSALLALALGRALRPSPGAERRGVSRMLQASPWYVLLFPMSTWLAWNLGFIDRAAPLRSAVAIGAVLALPIALHLASRRLAATRLGATATALGSTIAVAICVPGLVGLLVAKTLFPPAGYRVDAPNILVIVLDTVRADRLSSYGYDRATTPELDAFGRDGIRFTRFYSTSSWTVPSHASLFTGLYPIDHGATQERVRLDPRFATLAEILKNAGYQTWAASGNPWMGPSVNLDQGFDRFFPTWIGDRLPRPDDVRHPANVAFEAFLDSRDPDRPYFAFINYMDAHTPYAPPESALRRFRPADADPRFYRELERAKWSEHYRKRPFDAQELRALSNLYDAGLSALSRDVGKLLHIVESRGGFEDTLIIVTADHGEHFGENGVVGHMFGLYNTAVRIPLMIRLPGGARAGETVARKGQLIDLFTTLLAASGVETDGIADRGFDLLATDGPARESIFSEYYYPNQVLWQFSEAERREHADVIAPFLRRLRAVERYGHRFIWSSDGRHELYDIVADPGETRNLYPEDRRTPAADAFMQLLEEEMLEYVQSLELDDAARVATEKNEAGPGPEDIDEETLDALRAVGYVR